MGVERALLSVFDKTGIVEFARKLAALKIEILSTGGTAKLLREEGVTVLIIEHTMQARVQLVDEFSVLDHGRLIAAGRPDDIVRDRRVIEAYLGRRWMDRVADTAA